MRQRWSLALGSLSRDWPLFGGVEVGGKEMEGGAMGDLEAAVGLYACVCMCMHLHVMGDVEAAVGLCARVH